MRAVELGEDDWELWREARLRALREDPEAFASTYAGTLRRDTEGYWRRYFALPGAALLAVEQPSPAGPATPRGMLRLLTPTEPGAPAELISMWVAREARRRGVGTLLIEEAIRRLRSLDPGAALQLHVKEANPAARALYERCGFAVVGRNPDDDSELTMRL